MEEKRENPTPETNETETESAAARRLRVLGDRAIARTPETGVSREEAARKKREALSGVEERRTQPDGVVAEATDAESGAAAVVRVLSAGDSAESTAEIKKGNPIANFWYHHKWKVIVGAFFAAVLTVCFVQLFSHVKPDVYVLYVGPQYVNVTVNEAIKASMDEVVADFNGDGKRSVSFSALVYLNEDQIAARQREAAAAGERFVFDASGNSDNMEQFVYELASGNTVLYLLDPALYKTYCAQGLFVPLADVLGEKPAAAHDDYSIVLGDTALFESSSALKNLPRDTLVCLRRVPGMSYFTGRDKAEAALVDHAAFLSGWLTPAE